MPSVEDRRETAPQADSDLYLDQFSSGASHGEIVSDSHQDFLYLLAVAQDRDIDFLPIKWQPALDKIGAGATAEIRQSLINLQMSFAFKRLSSSSKQRKAEGGALVPLISEISVLGHPKVRNHRHIARLEAICWDISETDDEEVWPVLVFEKSQYGDLQRFLTSDKGRELGMDEGLTLCYHVATALFIMHSYRIIHGDIKPTNILIFKEPDGTLTAKLADFGYSVLVKGYEFIRLPQSRPFSAPEYHHRGIQFDDARRQDIYSLGMSCLWILFHDVLLEMAGNANEFIGTSMRAPQDPWGHGLLEKLKQDQTLGNLARRLVDQESRLSAQEKVCLGKFLELTLAHNPQERELDIAKLAKLLRHGDLPILDIDEIVASSPHRNFSIARYLPQLYMADYKVRKYIAKTLGQVQGHICKGCALNNSVQLGFCYAVGFGVERDEEKALGILEKIDKGKAHFESEIEIAQAAHFDYRNERLAKLTSLGFLGTVDHIAEYRKRETIEAVEAEFQREIKDVAKAFGNDVALTVHLRAMLSRIISGGGDYGRAEKLLLELQDLFEHSLDYPVTAPIYGMLAGVYNRQGRYEEAEKSYRQALELGERVDGDGHLHTQTYRNDLATVLGTQGKYKEAEEMKRRALEVWQLTLGEEHPLTLGGMADLATLLKASGDLNASQELAYQAHRGLVKALGVDHPDTLSSLANLGSILIDQGKYETAEKCFSQVLEARERLFGKNHHETLMAVNSLARLLHDQGMYNEAEEMAQRALEGMRTALKEEHPDTLQLLENLGVMFGSVGKYTEAEDVLRRALKAVEKIFGKEHPRALTGARNLALVQIDLGKYEDSEGICRKVLEKSKQILGDRHPDTLRTLNDLALSLGRQLKYEESEDIHRQALEGRLQMLGEKHPDTLNSYHNLASMLVLRQKYQEAEQMHRQTLEGRLALFGEQHPDTLDSVSDLASIDFFQGRYEAAEEGHRRALKGYEVVLGEGHPRTLTSANNVAVVLQLKGKFEDAERLHRRVLRGRTIALGADHPVTLSSKNSLSATLLSLGQYDAAADEVRDVLGGHQRLYGLEHPSTLSSISCLATILIHQERYDEGAKVHRQAFEGRIRVLGPDHIDTLTSLRKLIEVLIFLDRNDEVEEVASMVLSNELPGDDVGAAAERMSQCQLD